MKKEEYSETDIFGTDYSSSDNDLPENNDDDIESSDHDSVTRRRCRRSLLTTT